jgi:hypothetical protein
MSVLDFNEDELRFVSTGEQQQYSTICWNFYFDSVDGMVDKIVEWENMPAKSRAAVFTLRNCQSFYVDIIETLVARNRTENITCTSAVATGTAIRMCRVTREVLLRRLKQRPNKKIKFRGYKLGGDEARIFARDPIPFDRLIECEEYCIRIYSPSDERKVFFDFYLSEGAHDPYWPPEVVYVEMTWVPWFCVQDCCVCFEPRERAQRAPRLECGHGLCRSCFERWSRVRSTCPLCRSPLNECVPFVGTEAFNEAVASRPVGELWFVEKELAEMVRVSPWRWKTFSSLTRKPRRLLMDVDCIATTNVDETRKKFMNLVRIKRQKILCFSPSLPVTQNPPASDESSSS